MFLVAGIATFLGLAGCGGGDSQSLPGASRDLSGTEAEVRESTETEAEVRESSETEAEDVAQIATAMPTIDDQTWDVAAVHRVLRVFAYGGHAADAQISAWADMAPEAAIVEMLTFDEHNFKLSPPSPTDRDGLDRRKGTLRALSEFWSSDDPSNGTPQDFRERYRTQARWAWLKAATSRGLNPFRQKVGLWETNYHLVASDADATTDQIFRYYDDIMDAHARNLPYQQVLAVASTSAAIAVQYGHHNNVYVDGTCRCNEDFAREYFQLFFGILGAPAPAYHEEVTIKNMARVLTDMPIGWDADGQYFDQVQFGTAQHYSGPLELLNVSIGGADARQRIEQLSEYAINDPESLANLPVIIVAGLADDNLNAEKIAELRAGWAYLPQKNLLTFLRAYAISKVFHRADRVKYWTSIDRHVLLANKVALTNEDVDLNVYSADRFQDEGVQVFLPDHGVFGGQMGYEAADAASVFKRNYDLVTENAARYARTEGIFHGRAWNRDWSDVVPSDAKGRYVVQDVAQWLWNRLIGDGLKNFGPLEKAHLYALLATGQDLGYLLDPLDAGRVIEATDLTSDTVLIELVAELGQRDTASYRIGQAVNFIVGTPYVFADEGR